MQTRISPNSQALRMDHDPYARQTKTVLTHQTQRKWGYNVNRLFLDCESNEFITEDTLKAEFICMQSWQPQEYNFPFSDYVKNCTSKNGTLTEIILPANPTVSDLLTIYHNHVRIYQKDENGKNICLFDSTISPDIGFDLFPLRIKNITQKGYILRIDCK